MKVRLSDSMIRFRLSRDEVGNVAAGQPVFLTLLLDPLPLSVRLEPIPSAEPTASARGGLRIGIPSAWLNGWPESEVVGFDFEVEASSEPIRVIVEKDFPCAHGADGPPKPVRMP